MTSGRPQDPLSDEELVPLANAGDEAAFEAIYYRYRDWASRVAARFLRDRSEAADVLQEAFAYLFDKFPGFELTGTFKGLLYTTIKHICFDRSRRGRPSVSLEEAPEASLIDPAKVDSGSAGLLRSLRHLSAPHQEILLLRFVDDLTLAEIAESLEIPLGTAKSRLHNAIEALRALYGKQSGAE